MPSANRPVVTATNRPVDSSTAYPPSASASSAPTGTASTPLRSPDVTTTSTAPESTAPMAATSSMATVAVYFWVGSAFGSPESDGGCATTDWTVPGTCLPPI